MKTRCGEGLSGREVMGGNGVKKQICREVKAVLESTESSIIWNEIQQLSFSQRRGGWGGDIYALSMYVCASVSACDCSSSYDISEIIYRETHTHVVLHDRYT